MADRHVFPQDWATGLDEQVDWNDAGAFAHLGDHPNLREYVATGYRFDVNFDAPVLTVSEGKAFAYETTTDTNDHRDDDGPNAKELLGALFVLQRGVSGDLTLAENDTNYVYLRANQQNNDETEFFINTTGSPPTRPRLLLGMVDTETETIYEVNRAPTTKSRRLHVTGATHGHDYE